MNQKQKKQGTPAYNVGGHLWNFPDYSVQALEAGKVNVKALTKSDFISKDATAVTSDGTDYRRWPVPGKISRREREKHRQPLKVDDHTSI